MKKFFVIVEALLKLALLVALLVGAIFLVKVGLKLTGNDDIFAWMSKTDYTVVDTSVTYDDIYNAYKSNELAADELYRNNRYRITATVYKIDADGLLNLTGGATITMSTEVGDDVAVIIGEFEKDQEDALKQIVVGDTITFEGKCVSDGAWMECKIVG